MFDLEEAMTTALGAVDLPADLLPHMIWNEVVAGVQKRRVFLDVPETTDMLRGAVGTKISVPIFSTRFTATTITESALDSTGYTPAVPAFTDIDVSIGNQVYVAFRISDIIKEDNPKYDWIRILLRDAGRAIAEYEDDAVMDVLLAGVGNTVSAATYGTLVYTDIAGILAEMKKDSFFPEDHQPYLFLNPDQEKDLVTATTFVDSARRYTVQSAEDLGGADGPGGDRTIAGCLVRVSDAMITGLALVAMPSPHPQYGPTAIHAVKRPLTIRSDREELYGRQLWIASIRYGTSVIQANSLGLISAC
jgi:hypothetical protein